MSIPVYFPIRCSEPRFFSSCQALPFILALRAPQNLLLFPSASFWRHKWNTTHYGISHMHSHKLFHFRFPGSHQIGFGFLIRTPRISFCITSKHLLDMYCRSKALELTLMRFTHVISLVAIAPLVYTIHILPLTIYISLSPYLDTNILLMLPTSCKAYRV